MTMNIAENATLAILKKALWHDDNTIDPDTDWSLVFNEMKSQTVVALANDVISQFNLNAATKTLWAQEIACQLTYNDLIMLEQNKLIKLLERNNIPYAILKGAAAAQYYSHPEYRTQGDVDFLVFEAQFTDALDLLIENGYQQCSELIDGYCEVALKKNGVCFEIHRGLNTISNTENDVLNHLLADGLNNTELHTVNGYTFSVLPDSLNGLVLLSHLRQHLRDGLGLRQVIDWMMYVSHLLGNSEQYKSFAPLARLCGLEKLAITTTRMCQIYLGLSETITWCRSADEHVCKELMKFVFESGNFGYKKSGYDRDFQNKFREKGFFIRFLVELQSKGETSPAVKKHIILRPFAWLIHLCHIIKQISISDRDSFGRIIGSGPKKARQHRKLLKKLALAYSPNEI